ncbi:MAG: pilus assembly protein PilP [Janthinobacterium lividum]
MNATSGSYATAATAAKAATAANAAATARQGLLLLPALLLLTTLAGCGDSGVGEVRQWMDETKRQTRVAVTKVEEPKKFTPFSYTGKDAIDPYSPVKLAMALAKQKGTTDSGLRPDLDRRREPLESYPLDTLKMVGTLRKAGASFALLLADKALFQVKVGNYIGQNFGKVTKIADGDVELKEIVQDASGEWVERNAKLELQESKK